MVVALIAVVMTHDLNRLAALRGKVKKSYTFSKAFGDRNIPARLQLLSLELTYKRSLL